MQRIRIEVGGTVVRLFGVRSEAIAYANSHTLGSDFQHRAYPVMLGWLVHDVTNNRFFDTDGVIHANIVPLLLAKKAVG